MNNTSQTKATAKEIKDIILEAYGAHEKTINISMLKIFIGMLQNYPVSIITHAISQHFSDPERGHYAPLPSDLMRHIKQDKKTESIVAWEKVIDAVKKAGPWSSAVFDDPCIHVTIESLGGWTKLNELDYNELKFLSHDFKRLYVANKPTVTTWPNVLIGLLDKQRLKEGKPPSKSHIILIGNKSHALTVYEKGSESNQLSKQTMTSMSKALAL